MDTSNWWSTQRASGAMEFGDWRAQLQRQRIVNKIMDTLKTHLPFSRYESLQELKKIAERVENEIYTAATSQSEYSRKICFMMLTLDTRLQNLMLDSVQLNSPALYNSVNLSMPLDLTAQTGNPSGGDWQEEVYQKIIDMKDLYLVDLRHTQNASGFVGDTIMESDDWRAQLLPDSRERIRNKIMDTLKRHLPFSGHEGLQELKKITVRFEEKIYAVATSQSDYLQQISSEMVTVETRSQDLMADPMQSKSAANNINLPYSGSLVMQQVNNQGQQLTIQQMMSQSIHTNIGSPGMQGSSSLPFALPPGSSLHQPTMASVTGQSSNLQNIPNMSSVQQNQLISGQSNYSDTHQIVQPQSLRPTEGTSGTVGDTGMESGDWRAQLQADSRERIRNKIMDTLKRHLPFSGYEGLQELKRIAVRFEEKIYIAATSQSDYLRTISLKMLTMETRSQYSMLPNSAGIRL